MNSKVITAPEPYKRASDFEYSMFLAGAIDMGSAVDWQKETIQSLANIDNLIIVNPRRAKFDETTLDAQILWELEALESVDIVFMWFPRDSKAPISFLETGLYMQSNKLLIGAEDGFYRRRNLELTTQWYDVQLHSSLSVMIDELLKDQKEILSNVQS